jgi:hypothetical protein
MKTQKIITAFLVATLAMILLTFFGCGVKWRAKQCRKFDCCEKVKDSTVKIVRDTCWLEKITVIQRKDSATGKLLLECDSLGNVYILQSEYWQGKYVQLKTKLNNNQLDVTAEKPETKDSAYAIHTNHSETTTSDKVVRVKVNELTRWQQFRLDAFWPMLAGNVLFLIVLVVLVWRWIKRRFVR